MSGRDFYANAMNRFNLSVKVAAFCRAAGIVAEITDKDGRLTVWWQGVEHDATPWRQSSLDKSLPILGERVKIDWTGVLLVDAAAWFAGVVRALLGDKG